MTIQAVFLDMGGTIETFWYSRELRLQATPGLQELLLTAGIDLHLSNEQLFEVVEAGLKLYHKWRMQSLDELSPQRVWREYILPGYPSDAERLEAIAEDLMVYTETHYYHREMRPEMPEVLESIQKMGLKIGLISNVCSRGQVPANLDQYGIRHFFDPVVLSSEYGRRKPDPAIFHYAARLANAPTSECVHVGDRISRDILGAQKSGYRLAIQIRHHFAHDEDDTGAKPDAVIENMAELVDILKAELSRPTSDAALGGAPTYNIRALLFDAGDILYYRPKRWRQFNTFLKELGLPVNSASAEIKDALEQQAYRGQLSLDQYREAILRLYGVTRPEDIEHGKRILAKEDSNVKFFDNVKETLNTLKEQGYLLGIVTDTAQPLHVKLGWFEQAGFVDVWDSIVSSRELGMRKPDPGVYNAALSQLGVRAGEALFVGHKTSEIDGAKAVGMKTVALNYEDTAKADYYLDEFPGLLQLPLLS